MNNQWFCHRFQRNTNYIWVIVCPFTSSFHTTNYRRWSRCCRVLVMIAFWRTRCGQSIRITHPDCAKHKYEYETFRNVYRTHQRQLFGRIPRTIHSTPLHTEFASANDRSSQYSFVNPTQSCLVALVAFTERTWANISTQRAIGQHNMTVIIWLRFGNTCDWVSGHEFDVIILLEFVSFSSTILYCQLLFYLRHTTWKQTRWWETLNTLQWFQFWRVF